MKIHKLTFSGAAGAIGTLSAHLIYIPAGVSKCFPVQHAINVLGAVILGPGYATAVAFVISCLRNMFGTGSLLAFPGSMIGACLAGLCYSRFGTVKAAIAGEIFGTGILGGLAAWVFARFFLGSAVVAWFFIPPFLISTVGGSIIAGLILKSGILTYALPQHFTNKGNKSNL
ncbi:MAG: energy coupling factor transporter S component ThiW [Acidaminococcaceae bacterium]|nr:energy coupling factor transporter S component ThiW [Acidaminococcaceae bacterium]